MVGRISFGHNRIVQKTPKRRFRYCSELTSFILMTLKGHGKLGPKKELIYRCIGKAPKYEQGRGFVWKYASLMIWVNEVGIIHPQDFIQVKRHYESKKKKWGGPPPFFQKIKGRDGLAKSKQAKMFYWFILGVGEIFLCHSHNNLQTSYWV